MDVAWSLDPEQTPTFDPTDAVAITPGGGRLGSLLGGALDSRLVELSLVGANEGRVVTCELDELESSALGVPQGTVVRIVFAPADVLPDEIWEPLLERKPVAIKTGDKIARDVCGLKQITDMADEMVAPGLLFHFAEPFEIIDFGKDQTAHLRQFGIGVDVGYGLVESPAIGKAGHRINEFHPLEIVDLGFD